MGRALRLMVGREHALEGVVEVNGLYVSGKPRRDRNKTIRHPGMDAKVSLRPLKHRRLTIGEKPDTQSAALELSTATWPIARKRD
jgi:hypothetical protein